MNIRLIVICIVLVALLPWRVCAQEKKEEKNENVLLHPDKFYKKYLPNLRIKRDPPDTAYIKSYENYLSVGVHVLSPAIRTDVYSRKKSPDGFDASSKFRTNISDILGFSIGYRYISAGFAFLLKTGMNTHDDYAPTRYRTATIKYSGAASSFQFKYIRIKGFTDINQRNSVDPNPMFTQRPDLLSREYQFEGMRNFSWRKYSYIAPLTFSQRQVKSHGGFMLKFGAYYNQLSGDSAILDQRQQMYVDDFEDIKVIRRLSLRVAPGVGHNFVLWRKFYFAAAAFVSADVLLYKFLQDTKEKTKGYATLAFVWDGKASLGYQSRRLYGGIRFEAQRRADVMKRIQVNTLTRYTGFELGYRFVAPKFVKKVYKKTMPPGM